jgi:fumarate hydratase class II
MSTGVPKPETRTESDSMGALEVPADRMWGCQTQRSLLNFPIGGVAERMPLEVVHALALVKLAAARINARRGKLQQAEAQAIEDAAARVAAGELDDHFPLCTFQTGRSVGADDVTFFFFFFFFFFFRIFFFTSCGTANAT